MLFMVFITISSSTIQQCVQLVEIDFMKMSVSLEIFPENIYSLSKSVIKWYIQRFQRCGSVKDQKEKTI